MKRIAWIDVAKGFCIISVILGHLGCAPINRVVYLYHLMMFFLLSGYTLKVKPLSAQYVKGKFIQLMKPYFITCFSIMVMDTVIMLRSTASLHEITYRFEENLVRSYVASGGVLDMGPLSFPLRIGAIWFLPALFFGLVLTQAILNYGAKYRYGFAVGLLLLAQISARFIWLPFSIQSGMMSVLFILLGYDFHQKSWETKVKAPHYLVAAAVFAVGVYLQYTVSFVEAAMTDPLLSTLMGLCGCLLVYKLAHLLSCNRLLAFTGRNSIYILCIHLFELETVSIYYQSIVNRVAALTPVRALLQPYTPQQVASILFVAVVVVKFIFIYVAAAMILQGKKYLHEKWSKLPCRYTQSTADLSIQAAMGFVVVLMLVGAFPVAGNFTSMVNSLSIVSLVLLMGLTGESGGGKNAVIRSLVPYMIWGLADTVFAWLMPGKSVLGTVCAVIAGMSATQNVLSDVPTVGMAAVVLVLALVPVVDWLGERYVSKLKSIYPWCCLAFGLILAKLGLWLPWSVDVVLYLVVFYYLGRKAREHGVMDILEERPYLYFLLSTLWAYGV